MPIGVIDDVARMNVGTTTYYVGLLPSDKIKSLTFVPVIEASAKTFLEEEVGGYQRPGSISRMRAFQKYLAEHPNSVVPPIILSGRGQWNFVAGAGPNYGHIEINGPAAIIDGQHRVGGYIALYLGQDEVRPIPFIVLNDLDLEAEKEEFVDVNTTQKGVPRSLTDFLGESVASQVAWALNEDSDSPFKNRITRTGKLAREHLFQLAAVKTNIERFFDFGGFEEMSVEDKIDIAKQFWTIIADALPDQWADIQKLDDPASRGRNAFTYKLLETTGLIAWSKVGKSILLQSYTDTEGVEWDKVRTLVDRCKGIPWEKDGEFQGLTGEVGGARMAKMMERLLTEGGSEE
jgi:DNA sulfur modification protein DndB